MNFKKIKKTAFIGMVVSCLASFSFATNSEVTQNNEDVYCSPYNKVDNCIGWGGSPYSDHNVFLRAFIEKTDNIKLDFKDIPQSDDMTQKEIKELDEKAGEWKQRLYNSSIGKKIFSYPDVVNLEQKFSSVYEELNKLDNTGELGKLFQKAMGPKSILFFIELESVFQQNGFTEDQMEEYSKLIFDELRSPNISNDSLDKINAILGKLSNSSNLVSLFTDYFTNDFKPYVAERRFDNYVSIALGSYSENYIRNNAYSPITEYDTFFIRDVSRRPHSKRAEEILDKLDPNGELKNLYRGLFS